MQKYISVFKTKNIGSLSETEKIEVLVARTKIPLGKEIDKLQIGTKKIQKNAATGVHISVPIGDKIKRDRQKMLVVGRKSSRTIEAGDAILWSDLKKQEDF